MAKELEMLKITLKPQQNAHDKGVSQLEVVPYININSNNIHDEITKSLLCSLTQKSSHLYLLFTIIWVIIASFKDRCQA